MTMPALPLDRAWVERVYGACDRVFAAADVGFVGRIMTEPDVHFDLLWEAEPERFLERYPDSGVVEEYGDDGWPPSCLDFWVHVQRDRRARIQVEGWSFPEVSVELTGHVYLDATGLAHFFARVLAVDVEGWDWEWLVAD